VLQVAVVAVIVFAVLYLAVFDLPFTGLLVFERNVSVSITAEENGEISRFEFDQVITAGNSTFIDAELVNRGSVPLNSTYAINIYNVNGSLLYTYPGPTQTVAPGAIMGRTVKHTPHETGSYVVRARAEMGDAVLQSAKFLVVQEEQEVQQPDTITVTRTQVQYVYGPAPPEPEEPERGWQVAAPETLAMGQNTTTTLPIRITNTGEATERNIRLTLQHPRNMSVSYEPTILFALPPGETRSFLLTVRSGTRQGEQELSYRVRSEALQFSGDTAVTVTPTQTTRQLQDEVSKLQSLIDEADAKLAAMERQGMNVSAERQRLTKIRELVEQARANADTGDLAAARQQIDTAREDLSDLFQTLFKQQSQEITVQAPLVQPVYVLIVASILIAVLMVGGYYYLKEKHEERPKLLRDMDEEVEV
jgi:hypothetical protein